MRRVIYAVGAILLIALGLQFYGQDPSASIILVTTTSMQDSGLLDALVPVFEGRTGYRVKTVAIGTGQALAMGARGEADVALAHAPGLEMKYVSQGAFVNRRPVMHNDFLLIGPPDDPARAREAGDAGSALVLIARAGASFVSRGDNSGTHILEKKLWQESGTIPEGPWYIEAGQGMGATLMIASEKQAYALVDRGTFLAFHRKLQLEPTVEGDPGLLNPYHVMEVNPEEFPGVNRAGARTFSDFLVSAEAQEIIRSFGKARFGSPLFFPDADGAD